VATTLLLERIRYPDVRSDTRVVIRPTIVQRDSVATLPA
jgi:DNA-binding LacI/PurR family transcriptional regulator